MGREVRRVPADWQHPEYEQWQDRQGYKPLHGTSYTDAAEQFMAKANAEGLQAAVDYFGVAPDRADYMPEWAEEQCTHYMMDENTTEGTPISPAFETPEKLARWLVENDASAFADQTASYEAWLRVAQGGFACSAVLSDGHLTSGVEALS